VAPGEDGPREILLVTFGEKNQQHFARLKTSAKDGEISTDTPPPGAPARLTWKLHGDLLVLRGDGLEARMRRVRREDFLLVRRGFRWVNERPFNR
jgi:hypothetical protein